VRKSYDKDYHEFEPSGSLVLVTNPLPKIRDLSHAMWRRVRAIHHTKTIPVDQRRDRKTVEAEILAEAPGVFNWLLNGIRMYREDRGLDPTPEEVLQTTKDYKEESDPLGQFFADCLKESGSGKKAVVRDAYTQWANENREKILSTQVFNRLLRDRGVKEHQEHDGTRWWDGISLQGQRNI
jgi:putative DNA primase/helicase